MELTGKCREWVRPVPGLYDQRSSNHIKDSFEVVAEPQSRDNQAWRACKVRPGDAGSSFARFFEVLLMPGSPRYRLRLISCMMKATAADSCDPQVLIIDALRGIQGKFAACGALPFLFYPCPFHSVSNPPDQPSQPALTPFQPPSTFKPLRIL